MSTPTRYTVVQYLPNPLSGERINVGIIAWNEGRMAAQFLSDWRRVHSFGGEDIGFVRDFARRVEDAAGRHPVLPGLGEVLDEHRLEKIVGTWTHSIQFSEPRASLKAPNEVTIEMAPVFLREAQRRENRGRDRRAAAALVAQTVWAGMMNAAEKHEKVSHDLLKRNYPIEGKLDKHPFDVVVANGKPLFAAQGLSFEIADTRILEREFQATAWAITDVLRGHRDFPLAVLTLPPRGRSAIFDRAQKVFHGLRAAVAESPDDMEKWARRLAKRSLPHAGQ